MHRDPAFLAECQALARALRPWRTVADLREGREWPGLEARLRQVLAHVRRFLPDRPPLPSVQPDRMRAVHWNVEHGNRYERVEEALLGVDDLHDSDLVFLNETDLGMARAGNRDVVGELAQALGRYGVWAPMFLETGAGRYEDVRLANGRPNAEGLFGLGLLSRWPVSDVHLVELPSPEAYQFDIERMFGRHIALVATIERPGSRFVAVAVHLEVHRTRALRAEQMRVLLAGLERETLPVLLAGDFNTHTFDRGRMWDPLVGAAVLMFAPSRALEHRLLFPDQGHTREPLFDDLRQAGFEWRNLVDRAPTLKLRFDHVDELRVLPRLARRRVRHAMSWAERRARLRLDWFAARGFMGGRGHTVDGLDGRGRASDHAPIVCELW